MTYQQVNDNQGNLRTDVIVRTNDSGSISWIPNDPANNDWIIYQAWLNDGTGNEPLAPA